MAHFFKIFAVTVIMLFSFMLVGSFIEYDEVHAASASEINIDVDEALKRLQ